MLESDLERAAEWCAGRVPEGARARARVELETTANGGVIVETRAPLIGAIRRGWGRREVARLRYSQADGTWSLDWRAERIWRRYSRLAPTAKISEVLRELELDPVRVFWTHSPGSGGEERRRNIALA